MKNTFPFPLCRALTGLAAAGAALLCASSASAQTTTPYFAFVVDNLTSSNGSATFPVYDALTFSSVQVKEVFADDYTQTLSVQDLFGDAPGIVQSTDSAPTGLQIFTPQNGVGYSDLTHGALTSATLTGTLSFPGIAQTNPLTVSILTDPNGTPYEQPISTNFSASLFGPAQSGIGIGTFSLLNLGSSQGTTVIIDAQPVPEASSVITLGLLLALGLGTLVIARRRAAAAN